MARKTKETLAREAAELEEQIKTRAGELAKAQVSAMVPELVTTILAQVGAARGAAGLSNPVEQMQDKEWAQILAVAISSASDPGNKARRVSPEVLEQRKKAYDEMIQLLTEAYARQEMPVYIVLNKCFLKERKIEPKYMDPLTRQLKDMEINWPQIPNESMEPVNDVAKLIHSAFLRSIGSLGGQPRPTAAFVISGTKVMRTVPVTREVAIQQPMDSFDPRRTVPAGGRPQTHVHVIGTITPPAVVS